MACPTCGSEFAEFAAPAPFRYYHCRGCGTAVIRDGTGKLDDTVYVPERVAVLRGLLSLLVYEAAFDRRPWYVGFSLASQKKLPHGPFDTRADAEKSLLEAARKAAELCEV